jgi:hypothetical protein
MLAMEQCEDEMLACKLIRPEACVRTCCLLACFDSQSQAQGQFSVASCQRGRTDPPVRQANHR